jgi:hypothetical protein
VARHPSRFHRLLAAGFLAGSLSCSAGAVPPPGAVPPLLDEEVASITTEVGKQLSYAFELSKTPRIDPALRAQAESLRAAHLDRIGRLLPDWVRDEYRLQVKEGVLERHSVFYAVWARMLNELALWQIEPGNAAYEQAMLEAVKGSPGVCRLELRAGYPDFASRVMRLQAMPQAQRQAALAEERELLAHWGRPRAALAPWPDPLPQDAGMAVVARMRVEGPTPALALAPTLASVMLARHTGYDELDEESKCLFQQWRLRTSLEQGATPAAALNAFRYGTMITAMARVGRFFEEQNAGTASPAAGTGASAYPRLASVFDVQGRVTVRRRLDTAGRPSEVSVIKRAIAVRGIRDVRPVAFENTFDELTVKNFLEAKVDVKPGPDNSQTLEWLWTLKPGRPAPSTDSKTQGGAK